MNYIVKELQTTSGVTTEVAHPLNDPTNRMEAESAYHYILFAAAISSIEEHAAVILTQDGRVVRQECYKHYPEPTPVEPEPEPEPEEEPEET